VKTIVHWTIKVTWEDEFCNKYEEYISEIPDYVAKPVDALLDELENEENEDFGEEE